MKRQKPQPPAREITDEEVEQQIRECFSRNYDQLRQEGGHVLAEGARRQALEQVLFYWRKLRTIACSATETEVKLALPGQVTPKGRPFVIEGVVDIVRERNEVKMYDLKTHEAQEVLAERELYEDQLNVYAFIWKGIRRQSLDGTAIIATRLPIALRDALRTGDVAAVRAAIEDWQPVIDLECDQDSVQRTIKDFGRCVDAIEDGEFAPPSPADFGKARGTRRRKDHEAAPGSRRESRPTFAQIHCQNCDARFSCGSYRQFEKSNATRQRDQHSNKVMEKELDAWIDDNLTDD